MLGCAVTLWQETVGKRDALSYLEDELANPLRTLNTRLLKTKIAVDPNIDKAHLNTSGGGIRTIFLWTRGGAGKAYRDLTEEVLKHVNNA